MRGELEDLRILQTVGQRMYMLSILLNVFTHDLTTFSHILFSKESLRVWKFYKFFIQGLHHLICLILHITCATVVLSKKFYHINSYHYQQSHISEKIFYYGIIPQEAILVEKQCSWCSSLTIYYPTWVRSHNLIKVFECIIYGL